MPIQAWLTSAMGVPVIRDPAHPSNYDQGGGDNRPFFIVHDIEGGAGGARSKFKTPDQNGSTQYVVDGSAIYQMVSNHDTAYGCGNLYYNQRGVQVEIPGYHNRPYNPVDITTAARLCAEWARQTGYPIRRLTRAEVASRVPGVFGHEDVPDPNKPGYYGGSTNHIDPGIAFPWGSFLSQAQSFLEKGGGGAVPPDPFRPFRGYLWPTGFAIGDGFIRDYLTIGGLVPAGNLDAAIRQYGYPVASVSRFRGLEVQWFERARFERQRDGSLTFGLVGAESYHYMPLGG